MVEVINLVKLAHIKKTITGNPHETPHTPDSASVPRNRGMGPIRSFLLVLFNQRFTVQL